MNALVRALLLLSACGWMSACGEHGAPPPMTQTTDRASTVAETWVGNVVLNGGQAQTEEGRSSFALGEPITLTMEVGKMPAESTVRVVWYGPDERELAEESQPMRLGQNVATFTVQGTAGWPSGPYRVEIWIGGRQIKSIPFALRDPVRV